MPICKHCHKRIPDTVDVCPHCCQIVDSDSNCAEASSYIPSYTETYTSPYNQDHSCMCGEQHSESYTAGSFNAAARTRSGEATGFEHDCICDETHSEAKPKPVTFYHTTTHTSSGTTTTATAKPADQAKDSVLLIVGIVFLFVFWPIGIILIARNKALPKHIKIIIIVAALAVLVLPNILFVLASAFEML